MGLKEKLTKNPAVGAGIALVLIAIAALAVYVGTRPSRVGGAWYYDTSTGKFIAVHDPAAMLGIGQSVFVAHVFGCGRCGGGPVAQVAYLEKWTPDAIAAQKAVAKADPESPGFRPGKRPQGTAYDPDAIAKGRLVAKPEANPQWTAFSSNEGQRIVSDSRNCPEGELVVECSP